MERRSFLKYGAAGMVALAWNGHNLASYNFPFAVPKAVAGPSNVTIDLFIEEVMVELIDGEQVFMFAFRDQLNSARVPGPVLRVRENDTLTINVHNNAAGPHRFAITGIPAASTPEIPSNASHTVTFAVPGGGTYMYFDPSNGSVNRVLGLHGAMVVLPDIGTTLSGSPTPYSRSAQTPATTALFDALGTAPRFPGSKWDPDDPHREHVWIFNQIDPRYNAMAGANEPIDPATFKANFVPRYFTLNGLSGFDAAHDEATVPEGFVGQPTLIRTINAGLATHAPHIHGNHAMELSDVAPDGSVVVLDNIIERDTWDTPEMARKDILLPYERPPDIPEAVWPPTEEPFPMRYPMHCHNELSQTAGGGQYPMGLVTDWKLKGPLAT